MHDQNKLEKQPTFRVSTLIKEIWGSLHGPVTEWKIKQIKLLIIFNSYDSREEEILGFFFFRATCLTPTFWQQQDCAYMLLIGKWYIQFSCFEIFLSLLKQWWKKSVFSETKHVHPYYKFLCLLLIKIWFFSQEKRCPVQLIGTWLECKFITITNHNKCPVLILPHRTPLLSIACLS